MYVCIVILIAIETKAVPLLLIVTGPEGLCFQLNRFLVSPPLSLTATCVFWLTLYFFFLFFFGVLLAGATR